MTVMKIAFLFVAVVGGAILAVALLESGPGRPMGIVAGMATLIAAAIGSLLADISRQTDEANDLLVQAVNVLNAIRERLDEDQPVQQAPATTRPPLPRATAGNRR
jgi:drug/metabolite transporter (DMT)-like permease